ncbi:MAG: hypothetical protein IJ855_02965 [Bacteroidales bacterium]|nr:hypothetical protein [Bacteroidales bacterium]
MFTLDFTVTTSCCDSNGNLKLFSALQMMQDCSEMWIDTEPAVKDYFQQQNMAQLLASRQVEVVRVPKFKERLSVTTTVYDIEPMFGFRNTLIRDEWGVPCYKTWSMGAFVDKSTGKLKKIEQSVMDSLTIEPKLEMEYKERRIILPKDFETLHDFPTKDSPDKTVVACDPVSVKRSDIDYNNHMNNAEYVRIAMDLLPEDFKVRGMRVEYRIAAKLGDVLKPILITQEENVIAVLMLEDKPGAIIEFSR